MSFTTFSGPIRSGTVRTGAATAMNCGVVELVQTYTIPTAAILTSPAALPMFTLPAGSKITGIRLEVTEALTTATNCGIVIGTSGTANFYMTTLNTGTSIAEVSPATIAAATVADKTDNIGTSDVTIYTTPTAATGNAATGKIVVTIKYIQRTAAGSVTPTP